MKNAMEKVIQNTLLTCDELLTATAGFVVGRENGNAVFTSVATDSRNVLNGSLFVPLIGEKQDGHAYINQAVENGASIIFIAESEYKKNGAVYEKLSEEKNVLVICVQNTLKALQAAAACYVRKFPKLIRIAVTGSSGKTTTKEIAVSILKQKYRVVYSEGNLNSETGLPLSVFKIREGDEAGFFEMGMNHKNEIADLAAILRPQYAAVTNIGTAHIGLLGSRQNIAEEKRKIFTHIEKNGAAVIPASDDFADYLAENVTGKVIRYSAAANGITDVKSCGIEGTAFDLDGTSIHLRLPGTYNFFNALAAIALTRELGVSVAQIKTGIEKVSSLNGRSQILHFTAKNGLRLTVLQDCYNANPDSMAKALLLCSSVSGKKILVLGDMLELGSESEKAHAGIGTLCAEKFGDGNTSFIFIGSEMKYAADAARKNGVANITYSAEYDKDSLKKIAADILSKFSGDVFLLLKGSHGIGLERISTDIQELCK